jgi:hypothetical protein
VVESKQVCHKLPDSMRQKTVNATFSFGLRNAFPAGLLNESSSMIRPALQ